MTEKQLKSRHEKELAGISRASKLFEEFLEKNIFYNDYAFTYGKSGNYPVKANIRLFNTAQKYKNRPVYTFEIGYPNITNDSTFNNLLELVIDKLRTNLEGEIKSNG